MLFLHLMLCISMFRKFLFTANLLLKAALFLLMKNAGTTTVTMTPTALIQHEKPQNYDDPAKWMKWEEDNGCIFKNQNSGSVSSLYNYLSSILPDFFMNTFVKRKQAKRYEDEKSEAAMKNSNTAMLQVDFAENYTCTAQDEVQSAHWK